jgi:hypothetical protein
MSITQDPPATYSDRYDACTRIRQGSGEDAANTAGTRTARWTYVIWRSEISRTETEDTTNVADDLGALVVGFMLDADAELAAQAADDEMARWAVAARRARLRRWADETADEE